MGGVTADYFKELFSGYEEEANPPTDQFLSIKMHFGMTNRFHRSAIPTKTWWRREIS
jgi:hypothetical protein